MPFAVLTKALSRDSFDSTTKLRTRWWYSPMKCRGQKRDKGGWETGKQECQQSVYRLAMLLERKLPPVSYSKMQETHSPACMTSTIIPSKDYLLHTWHLKQVVNQISTASEVFPRLFCLVKERNLPWRWSLQSYRTVSAEIVLQYWFTLHIYPVSWCISNLGRLDWQE